MPRKLIRRELLLSTAALAIATSVHARPLHARNVSSGPVAHLSDYTIPFGALSRPNFGETRLSSNIIGGGTVPGSFGTSVSFPAVTGLPLVAPNSAPIKYWTVTQQSGCACWQWGSSTNRQPLSAAPSQNIEGADATTPYLTAAGAANSAIYGASDMSRFQITGTDALGNTSTANLTMNLVAGAASLGNDVMNNNMLSGGQYGSSGPTNFQKAGGNKIIITPGFDENQLNSNPLNAWTTRLSVNGFAFTDPTCPGPCSNPVVMEWADQINRANRGNITNLSFTNTQNFMLYDVTFVGEPYQMPPAGAPYRLNVISSSNFTWNKGGVNVVPGTDGNAIGLLVSGNPGTVTAENLTFKGSYEAFSENGRTLSLGTIVLHNVDLDQIGSNGLNLGSANYDIDYLRDVRPTRVDGTHMDSIQISSINSPTGTIKHTFIATAGGNATIQGPGFTNAGLKFVGSVTGGILTVSNGAGFSPFSISPSVRFICPGMPTGVSSQVTSDGTGTGGTGTYNTNYTGADITSTTCYIAAPQIAYSDVMWAGTDGNAWILAGGNNLTLNNLDVLHAQTGNPYAVTVLADLSGTTGHIESFLGTTDVITGLEIVTAPYGLYVSGSLVQQIKTPVSPVISPANVPYAITLNGAVYGAIAYPAGTVMTASEDLGNPSLFIQNEQDIDLINTGSNQLKDVFVYDTYETENQAGANTGSIGYNASWTLTNVINNSSSASNANSYKIGCMISGTHYDVQYCLQDEGVNGAHPLPWATMTIDQIVSAYWAPSAPTGLGLPGGGEIIGSMGTGTDTWADGTSLHNGPQP